MIKRDVKYNRQYNNNDFAKLHPWQQCFSTSAWMLLGYLCPDKYDGGNDEDLAHYIEDVSNYVGLPGIGEIAAKQTGIDPSYESSYFWEVQRAALIKYLAAGGKHGTIVYMDANCNWENLYKAIDVCPVILGTNKMGGLPGGHIILVTGYADNGDLFVHDPYGNATTGYKDKNGENVVYSKAFLTPFVGVNHIRAMWYY